MYLAYLLETPDVIDPESIQSGRMNSLGEGDLPVWSQRCREKCSNCTGLSHATRTCEYWDSLAPVDRDNDSGGNSNHKASVDTVSRAEQQQQQQRVDNQRLVGHAQDVGPVAELPSAFDIGVYSNDIVVGDGDDAYRMIIAHDNVDDRKDAQGARVVSDQLHRAGGNNNPREPNFSDQSLLSPSRKRVREAQVVDQGTHRRISRPKSQSSHLPPSWPSNHLVASSGQGGSDLPCAGVNGNAKQQNSVGIAQVLLMKEIGKLVNLRRTQGSGPLDKAIEYIGAVRRVLVNEHGSQLVDCVLRLIKAGTEYQEWLSPGFLASLLKLFVRDGSEPRPVTPTPPAGGDIGVDDDPKRAVVSQRVEANRSSAYCVGIRAEADQGHYSTVRKRMHDQEVRAVRSLLLRIGDPNSCWFCGNPDCDGSGNGCLRGLVSTQVAPVFCVMCDRLDREHSKGTFNSFARCCAVPDKVAGVLVCESCHMTLPMAIKVWGEPEGYHDFGACRQRFRAFRGPERARHVRWKYRADRVRGFLNW